MKNRISKTGFTLIEMSLVLVIIALLVAMITAGTSLLEQSKLTSVVSDINKFKTAIDNFKQKYSSLPGDMIDASNEWSGCDSTDNTYCNGNGNGRISSINANTDERYRFWQHLELAGQIKGHFTGRAGSGTVIDTNVPGSRISGAGFFAEYVTLASPSKAGNSIRIGTGSLMDNSILTPVNAQTIDEKIDDGLANSGDAITYKGSDASNATCLTGADGTGYKLDTNSPRCKMYFFLK